MRSEWVDPDEPARVGWPRPHYVVDAKVLAWEAEDRACGAAGVQDLAPIGALRYSTWAGDTAASQVTMCSTDRTWLAGVHHLCASCGHVMTRGLVIDREWINTAYAAAGTDRRLGRHDTNYGSPTCYRCIVLALRHCPWLKTFDAAFGADLQWIVTTGAGDFLEFDDTTAIAVVDPARLARVTTGQVRADVQAGRVHVLDVTADDLPAAVRPRAEVERPWGPMFDLEHCTGRHKSTLERTLAAAAWGGRRFVS